MEDGREPVLLEGVVKLAAAERHEAVRHRSDRKDAAELARMS